MELRKLLLLSYAAMLCSGIAVAGFLPAEVSQDGGKINQKDTSGKKQGKWIYLGKDRPNKGFPSEGKIEEGDYKDDRKEGTWIKYYNDGVTPKLKGYYKNNRPEGEYVKLSPKGIVIEKGNFIKGKYIDSLVRYNADGSLSYQGFYNEQGNEEGKIKYFYSNGQLEFEYTSENGSPRGKAVRYHENGDVKEIIQFGEGGQVVNSEKREMVNPAVKVKDPSASKEQAPTVGTPNTKGSKFLPNGYNKIYNANHEIWQDGEFKNGRLWDGKVYEYDRDGILLKVRVFKGGVYHSDGQLN